MAGPGDPRSSLAIYPAVRNSDPAFDDWGIVSRIISSTFDPVSSRQVSPLQALRTVVFPDVNPKTLVAENLFRGGLTLVNNSSVSLYIALESPLAPITVSTTFFTLIILPGDPYVMPFPMFLGRIDGLWAAGFLITDNVQVTEMTL